MNANDDNRSLIPLPDGSLANTAAGASRILSAMVSETLSIAHEQTLSPVFSLLIGNHDDLMSEVYANAVRIALGERFTVSVSRFTYAEELLEAVRKQSCDLCVVVLNNILYRGGGNEVDERITKAVNLIAQIKTAGASLIFAITGHIDAADLPKRVKQAGADSFFFVGCSARDFRHALEPRRESTWYWEEYCSKGLDIGNCRWADPDYWQLAVWANGLAITREEVIKRLVKCGTVFDWRPALTAGAADPSWDRRTMQSVALASSLFEDNILNPNAVWERFTGEFGESADYHLELLRYKFKYRPSETDLKLRNALDWDALYARVHFERLCEVFESKPENEPPLVIAELRWDFDLLPLYELPWVEGVRLYLSARFQCSLENRHRISKLAAILPELRSLTCPNLGLKELDVSLLTSLEDLECDGNEIEVLDVRPLTRLRTLKYDADSTRLIQRPDQHF